MHSIIKYGVCGIAKFRVGLLDYSGTERVGQLCDLGLVSSKYLKFGARRWMSIIWRLFGNVSSQVAFAGYIITAAFNFFTVRSGRNPLHSPFFVCIQPAFTVVLFRSLSFIAQVYFVHAICIQTRISPLMHKIWLSVHGYSCTWSASTPRHKGIAKGCCIQDIHGKCVVEFQCSLL